EAVGGYDGSCSSSHGPGRPAPTLRGNAGGRGAGYFPQNGAGRKRVPARPFDGLNAVAASCCPSKQPPAERKLNGGGKEGSAFSGLAHGLRPAQGSGPWAASVVLGRAPKVKWWRRWGACGL